MQTGPVLTALKNPISEQTGDGSESSTNPKKGSCTSGPQSASPQKQDAPAPFIGGMQTGPAPTALKNAISGQNGYGSENSDPMPAPVSPNRDPIADKVASNTPDLPGAQVAKSSGADDTDSEQTAEISAALQEAVPDVLGSDPIATTAPTSASKSAAVAQPQAKAPDTSRLNTLLQSLEPATHRETAALQAQTPTAPSDPNNAAQPAQAQASDTGNSGNSHSHGGQTSSDATQPQSAPQPAAGATAAVTPMPAPMSTIDSIANLTANNTSGISAAAGTQSAGASAGGATLQVAPAPQTNAQAAQPDLALTNDIAARAGAKQFDISLEPAELGRVEVRLTVDGSGNAQAHLVAERPEMLQYAASHSATLTHALE